MVFEARGVSKITWEGNEQKESRGAQDRSLRSFNIEMLEWRAGAKDVGGKPEEFYMMEAKVFQEGGSGLLCHMPWEVT